MSDHPDPLLHAMLDEGIVNERQVRAQDAADPAATAQCAGCTFQPDPDGVGWCYMFRTAPPGPCAQRRPGTRLAPGRPHWITAILGARIDGERIALTVRAGHDPRAVLAAVVGDIEAARPASPEESSNG